MSDVAKPEETIPAVVSLMELGSPKSFEGPVKNAPTAAVKQPNPTKKTLFLESGIGRRMRERTTTTPVKLKKKIPIWC